MKLKVKEKGSFRNTESFLKRASSFDLYKILDKYGRKGVEALSLSTPKDSGSTAEQWSYDIERKNNSYRLSWSNPNRNDGVSIAILLQYGHATKNGGYVEGIDYINPVIKEITEDILHEIRKEVSGW